MCYELVPIICLSVSVHMGSIFPLEKTKSILGDDAGVMMMSIFLIPWHVAHLAVTARSLLKWWLSHSIICRKIKAQRKILEKGLSWNQNSASSFLLFLLYLLRYPTNVQIGWFYMKEESNTVHIQYASSKMTEFEHFATSTRVLSPYIFTYLYMKYLNILNSINIFK